MISRGNTTFGTRRFGNPSFPLSFIDELMDLSMQASFFDKGEPDIKLVADFMDCEYMSAVTQDGKTTLYISGKLRGSPIYVMGNITVWKQNIFDTLVSYSYMSGGDLTFRTNKSSAKTALSYITFDALKKHYKENWVHFNRSTTPDGMIERTSGSHPHAFKSFKYRHEQPLGKGTSVSFMCVDLDANGNVENFSFNTLSTEYE